MLYYYNNKIIGNRYSHTIFINVNSESPATRLTIHNSIFKNKIEIL